MESSYLHTAAVSLWTKGLLLPFHPWSILHWNSSWLPWLPGYLMITAWNGLTQNLCLWPLYIYLLRTMRSHNLQSDWSARHSSSQWRLWGLRHDNVPLCPSTWVSGCWGRPWYYFLTPDPSVCLILGSGDWGAWCFFSWPSDFLSVPFILLTYMSPFNTPASSIPVWTSAKHFSSHFSTSESSSHFIFGPPSSYWGFLRGLRNLRAST